MSLDRLIYNIAHKGNPTVLGLDPKLDYIPQFIRDSSYAKYGKTLEGAADAVFAFNKALIDELSPIVPAVKPQCAYYEMYGWHGMKTLAGTIAYAQSKGMFVITDGKRNDIGSTMEAYATAHLGVTDVDGEAFAAFGGDALTVNGYLGTDGIKPLMHACNEYDKGIFVLVKTSNPSSGELQDKCVADKPIYELMADMCEAWGKEAPGKQFAYSSVGAVVGATYKDQLKELRQKCPTTFFLIPGYGAQGGGAEDVAVGFDMRGGGAIVNSSRAIMCAYQKDGSKPEDFAKAAYNEAVRMRDAIIAVIGEIQL